MSETPSDDQDQAPTDPSPAAPAEAAATKSSGLRSIIRWLPIAGAAFMLLSVVLPWWSIDVGSRSEIKDHYGSDKEAMEDMRDDTERMKKATRADRDFYEDLEDATDGRLGSSRGTSESFNGFNFGSGITIFIFSLLMLGGLCAAMFVPALGQWSWAIEIFSAVLALVALILAFIFLCASPGKDFGALVSQGVSIGVFFALFGSLAAMVGTVPTVVTTLKGLGKG